MMIAKTFPLLLFGVSAIAAPLPATDQPELARLAQPYAQQLRAVGITRMISQGSRDMVRLETQYGPVYVRYPAGAPDMAFVVDVGPVDLQASASSYDKDQDAQVLAAVVPDAVRVTAANNRLEWLRANPWH
jgi:hypothetical protein